MKRLIDIVLSAAALVALAPVLLLTALAVRLTSPGPALFRTERIGRDNRRFQMLKFRTMRTDTPQVATHLMADPSRYLTPIGKVLRTTSVDEIPQLLHVFCGEMSLVGPRPALFNQDDLVALRTERGIHTLLPGLTGWAQVNGRDELPIAIKVRYDEFYLHNQSVFFDLKILWLTVLKVFVREGVSH
jgi:O-antigen biosynthesis protein WbqP